MFLQIADAVCKIVDLLGKSEAARDTARRREIGSALLQIYRAFDPVVDQARDMEDLLGRMATLKGIAWGEDGIRPRWDHCKRALLEFRKVFGEHEEVISVFCGLPAKHLSEEIEHTLWFIEIVISFHFRQEGHFEVRMPLDPEGILTCPLLRDVCAGIAYDAGVAGYIKDHPFSKELRVQVTLDVDRSREGLKALAEQMMTTAADQKISGRLEAAREALNSFIGSHFKVEELF